MRRPRAGARRPRGRGRCRATSRRSARPAGPRPAAARGATAASGGSRRRRRAARGTSRRRRSSGPAARLGHSDQGSPYSSARAHHVAYVVSPSPSRSQNSTNERSRRPVSPTLEDQPQRLLLGRPRGVPVDPVHVVERPGPRGERQHPAVGRVVEPRELGHVLDAQVERVDEAPGRRQVGRRLDGAIGSAACSGLMSTKSASCAAAAQVARSARSPRSPTPQDSAERTW